MDTVRVYLAPQAEAVLAGEADSSPCKPLSVFDGNMITRIQQAVFDDFWDVVFSLNIACPFIVIQNRHFFKYVFSNQVPERENHRGQYNAGGEESAQKNQAGFLA